MGGGQEDISRCCAYRCELGTVMLSLIFCLLKAFNVLDEPLIPIDCLLYLQRQSNDVVSKLAKARAHCIV